MATYEQPSAAAVSAAIHWIITAGHRHAEYSGLGRPRLAGRAALAYDYYARSSGLLIVRLAGMSPDPAVGSGRLGIRVIEDPLELIRLAESLTLSTPPEEERP